MPLPASRPTLDSPVPPTEFDEEITMPHRHASHGPASHEHRSHPYRSHRRVLAALAGMAGLAAALLAGSPSAATAAPAAQPPAVPPPMDDPGPGSGDAVIYPQWYPVAVLEMPPLVRPGRIVEIVLDDSTGDVVEQEFRIDDADGQPWLVIRPACPPGPDCWLAFSIYVPGVYTATLTVTGPSGETTSVSHDFVVFQFRPLEL